MAQTHHAERGTDKTTGRKCQLNPSSVDQNPVDARLFNVSGATATSKSVGPSFDHFSNRANRGARECDSPAMPDTFLLRSLSISGPRMGCKTRGAVLVQTETFDTKPNAKVHGLVSQYDRRFVIHTYSTSMK